MAENTVRDAIGKALDYPLAEEAFALVDVIEANVRDGEPGGELHEVAAEITERIVEILSTRQQANLWAILQADGAYLEKFGEWDADSTGRAITLDLWSTIEDAVHAALVAFAEESDR